MTTTLLTPLEFGASRPFGATMWRKQLLPVGEINYEGRKIAFTREYLAGLVKAFADKAYDAVPFQFADRDNKHTNKPEDRRGTVRSLELTDDGLDIIVEAGAAASEHLAEYPDLGVSASIAEDYARADGKFFPAAIRHVLGTLDPRITGLRPWQAVDASNPAGPGSLWQGIDFAGNSGDVIDLTDAEYGATEPAKPAGRHARPSGPPAPDPTAPVAPTTEETPMALTEAQEARLAKLLDLPDDKFDALLADAPQPGEEELLTDAELAALLAEIEAGEEAPAAEPAGEPAAAGAALSAEAQAAIDLANSRAEEQGIELARITQALDKATYEREREQLARVHGIPPRITDVARDLLEGTGRSVELANGRTADAGAIVRKLLAEVGKTVKMLDLSAEMGTPLDGGAQEAAEAEAQAVQDRADLIGAYRQMAGI
jgi:hypothetical protein